MAHYAFLDGNNIVIEVISGKEEGEDGINWEERYSEIRNMPCKRTSYNTKKGVHTNGGTPFRKNFAGIGYTYNKLRDCFIPPKPYASWTLNEESCSWVSPTPLPSDVGTGTPPKMYEWDEITHTWFDVTPTE